MRLRAGAQQLEARLVADLHPPARQQRDAAAQVGELRALAEVQLRAGRAELVVEMVDLRILLLADVAVPADRRVAALAAPSSVGGKTFGVVNTGLRRSSRMPVCCSTASSRWCRRPCARAPRPSCAGGARPGRGCRCARWRRENGAAPPPAGRPAAANRRRSAPAARRLRAGPGRPWRSSGLRLSTSMQLARRVDAHPVAGLHHLARMRRPAFGDRDAGEHGALHHHRIGHAEDEGLRRDFLPLDVVERPAGGDAALGGRERSRSCRRCSCPRACGRAW